MLVSTVFCALIQEERYAHSYAYDWRTKLPTIYRATDQWFASVDGFRYVLPQQRLHCKSLSCLPFALHCNARA
jgi:isoleucyl-tRNA synthetase